MTKKSFMDRQRDITIKIKTDLAKMTSEELVEFIDTPRDQSFGKMIMYMIKPWDEDEFI